MKDWIFSPWPWYIAGPMLGFTVPLLLILGNKSLGISSSLRHTCAACFPSSISFFQYDWKMEMWNLFFVGGIFFGAALGSLFLSGHSQLEIHPQLHQFLTMNDIDPNGSSLLPRHLFSWQSLGSLRGFIIIVIGGFLVGFGARYAGGCTSGHSIMGIANLQWTSLLATCCFMIGGFLMANWLLPLILSL